MKLKPNQFYLPSGALITERPILYQTEMIQANMNDLKTQTRRTKGLDMYNEHPNNQSEFIRDEFRSDWEFFGIHVLGPEGKNVKSPYGKPGDLLWAKETWHSVHDDKTDEFIKYGFKADWSYGITSHPKNKGIWNASIHMPKVASRIWSMVEDIRIERLHDISEADAIAEGIGRWVETRMKSQPIRYKVYCNSDPEALYTSSPIDSYGSLWTSINGQASLNSNPWLWVIKYRILSKTGRPSLDVIERNYLEVMGKEVVND